MSIKSKFYALLNRHALSRTFDGPVTMRFRTDARTARFVLHIFEKLIADSSDGETRRLMLARFFRAERPVIEYLRGTTSSFRIDGPWYRTDGLSFPMGGLLQSPGVTFHANPIEAVALSERIAEAIEEAILDWIDIHDLQSLPPVDPCVNRNIADPLAIERIEQWLEQNPADGSDLWEPNHD